MSSSPVPAAGCATKPNAFNDDELLVTVTLLLLPASTPKLFNSRREWSMLTDVAAVDTTETPCPALLVTSEFVTQTRPPELAILIPFWVKPKIAQFSIPSALPLRNWTPFSPVPIPLMRRFLRITTSVDALADTTIPFRAADQNGSHLTASAVNGDGFGNGHCAVPGWIQCVNFAARCRLGNCAGKCLAGGRAAAGVNVVSNT